MPIEITMPRLSDTMEQGTIVAWNVKEGDQVSAGQTLGDIETDKATMELQGFDDGTVAAILLDEGQTVEVGSLIMVLAEEGEDVAEVKARFTAGAGKSESKSTPSSAAAHEGANPGDNRSSTSSTAVIEDDTARSATPAPDDEEDDEPRERVFVSPLARKIAEERGINLATIDGTGPGGRIVRKDVENAEPSASPAPTSKPRKADARRAVPVTPVAGPAPESMLMAPGAPLEDKTAKLSNMRRTIATRLVQSKQSIPHYQVTLTVSMDALLDLRERLNEQLASQSVKLSVNDFLVRACALAMHRHPYINASWGADGQSIELHAAVNVGVAIALPIEQGGGLVVATLRNADRMGLRMISSETRRLAGKARERGLSIDEMADATFTISNLGMYGVEHFTAIINPPNSAILAVGAAVEKPVVRDGAIVVGHEMQMTMSSDHRVIDGAMAAQYLATVKAMLEAPATLLV